MHSLLREAGAGSHAEGALATESSRSLGTGFGEAGLSLAAWEAPQSS